MGWAKFWAIFSQSRLVTLWHYIPGANSTLISFSIITPSL
jgi:hypothetical protein